MQNKYVGQKYYLPPLYMRYAKNFYNKANNDFHIKIRIPVTMTWSDRE